MVIKLKSFPLLPKYLQILEILLQTLCEMFKKCLHSAEDYYKCGAFEIESLRRIGNFIL